jgi:hypothetical protein
MAGFDQAWVAVANVRDGEPVSPHLRPLLEGVYHQSLAHPVDSSKLKKNLEDLLLFLSGEGRSNANCWAADLFFARSEAWEKDWAELNLPEGLHDVLSMMGEALHDTVQAPEVAKSFGCLPEQLLERLRQLPDSRNAKGGGLSVFRNHHRQRGAAQD